MKIKVLKTEVPQEFSTLVGDWFGGETHPGSNDFEARLTEILKDEKNYMEVEIGELEFKDD